VNGFYAVSIDYIADASGAYTRRWQVGDVFIEDGATSTLEALIIASNVPDDIALGVFYQILAEAQEAAEDAQNAAAAAQAAADAAAGSAASISIGTGPTQISNNTMLNTRLGTSGNLGSAAQRAVGTAAANIPDNTQLNVRIGTSGNLGSMAQQASSSVAVSGGSINGLSSLGINGNTTIAGSGRKIIADMSSATISNLLTFQSSVTDGYTIFNVAPNGAGSTGGMNLYNAADVNNSSYLGVACNVDHTRISSSKTGSAVSLPLFINAVVGVGVVPANIDASCNLQVANGIKVGNTNNANNNVFDWCEKKGSFTPRAAGTTSAGTATPISTPLGKFTRLADRVDFTLTLNWSAHTGTGNLAIDDLPYVSSSTAVNCTLSVYFNGLVVGAGKQLAALIAPGTSRIVLRQCDLAGGAFTSVPMDNAVAELTISGVYFTN
jgi:hypothetical protein